ncbi:MAG TPA: TetR/AcrR family transcriptional regulator [Longimicrobiaceae bacterium]|nr:TetR/AcrR family transcriptional regulator [Longimicrobiaceae bacterium]
MAPRSEALNERLRGESRAKILEHALRLFAEHGYDRTSVKMIAEAAGIAQGLLYNYFESKEHLLREIFAQSMRDVQESFAEAEASGSAEERIERLIRASFAIVRRHEPFWRLSYGVRMQAPVLAALGDAVPRWTETIRATLEGYFREAGAQAPDLEAAILFALIDGVSQHYVLDPESYPLDAVAERIVASYRRGGNP